MHARHAACSRQWSAGFCPVFPSNVRRFRILFTIPLKLAPYRVTALGDLDIRAPGLTATDPAGNASDVFVNILADDTQDLSDIIWRRIELLAAQILTTGRVRYRLDAGEYEEFGFGPGVPNVYNPPIPWDQPTATPITDLKNVRSQIIRDAGVAPDVVVFSDRTADLFTASEQVQTQLNKLHFVVGQLEPTRPSGTARWLGRLLLPALEMWAYSESYIDEFDGETVNGNWEPGHGRHRSQCVWGLARSRVQCRDLECSLRLWSIHQRHSQD
jgi:hypothetical protein